MQKLFWACALALATLFGAALPAVATVNINTASKDELIALPGIGPAKAQAIIDHRKANGPFKAVDDLKNVKGIGAKRLDKLRNDVSVGPASAKVAVAAGSAKSDTKGPSPSGKGEVSTAAEPKPKK